MKVAICGAGPLGLEMGLRMSHLGASVTIFTVNPPGGSVQRMAESFADHVMNESWQQLTTELGREAVGNPNGSVTLGNYWNQYLKPLAEKLEREGLIRTAQVDRIHKRFLSLDESVAKRSRLHDLFRLVFKVDPKQIMAEQMTENAEMFGKLDSQILQSLGNSYELYDDFDIVIDARGPFHRPLPMGPSSAYALNEPGLISHKNIFYGQDCLKVLNQLDEIQHLVMVGCSELAGHLLTKLAASNFFSQAGRKITLISPDDRILEGLQATNNPQLKQVLSQWEQNFKRECENFERATHEWRSQEDYIRAKLPKPQLPERKLDVFTGYNVTAIDKLVDQAKLFLTMEQPDFRSHGEEGLKTLATDAICVMSGYELDAQIYRGLQLNMQQGCLLLSAEGGHPEPGLFTLIPIKLSSHSMDFMHAGLEMIPLIEAKILTYFQRA